MKMDILQHNFKSEKPTSIFTTRIVDDLGGASYPAPTMNEKIIKTIRDSGDVQAYKTNVKAYMTDWDMKGKPGFVELEKIILQVCGYLSEKYFNKGINLTVDNLWGMIYKKSDHANVHDHWPALWSGVYYVKAPKDSGGDLVFPQLKQRVKPQDGMMIIFDGHTRHGVEEVLGDEERIAVSFNVKENF